MTLGKKLSNYRKVLGLTQQQLGEHLNLSAQAVSKWENDLAEPDLTTLKALANLYQVSLDELLNTDEATPSKKLNQASTNASNLDAETVAQTVASALDDKMKETPKTIGFCKNCGITVTEENVGKTSPIVLCDNCHKAELAEEMRKKQEQLMAMHKRNEEKNQIKKNLKKKRIRSMILGGIVGTALFALFIPSLIQAFDFGSFLIIIFLSYAAFSFVTMLNYECAVTNVISYMCSASIRFPGLIYTFDVDGILWMIGMRILFAAIGFIFGLICTCIGIILGMIIAPFVFPYIMIRFNRDIKNGVESEYIL